MTLSQSQPAVLLVHGFTGSRTAMLPWAQQLQEAGFQSMVPVLPGHETSWQQLARVGFGQWIEAVEHAYDQLAARHDTVFAAGLSMGGALALHLATRRRLAGVSLVNPGLVVDSPLARYAPALRWVVPSVAPISNNTARPGTDEQAYGRTPVAAVAQLYKLFAQVRARLGLVDCPVQLFRSSVDDVVSDASVRALVHGLAPGVLAEHHQLLHSKHVATLDYDAGQIFMESARFFAAQAAAQEEAQ